MARSRGQLGLKERIFNDQFDGLVFFINTISPDGRHLREVFITDERSPETKSTIVAEEGFLVHDPSGKRITLRLLRGQIFRVGDEMESLQTIRFQNYDFNLDLDSFALNEKDFRKRERHLSFTELRQALTSTKLDSKKRNNLSFLERSIEDRFPTLRSGSGTSPVFALLSFCVSSQGLGERRALSTRHRSVAAECYLRGTGSYSLDQNRKRISVQTYSPCTAKRGTGCFLAQDPFKKLARVHPGLSTKCLLATTKYAQCLLQ
jgi:hypothetical protein